MMTKKIMVTPCIEKTWLYRPSERKVLPGWASWMRSKSASTPPNSKKNIEPTPYIMPIFL